MYFFGKKTHFLKVILQTHARLTRNWKLFFILTLWSYSKSKDLLHTLNVYKIPPKEHKVVDWWPADELSVL